MRLGMCALALIGVAACGGEDTASLPPADVTVKAGQSIQDAIDAMPAGAARWVVAVEPGVYKLPTSEALNIIRANVELRGISTGPGFDGARPVIDGEGTRKDGVQAYGANFTMRGMALRNFTGNGVKINKTTNVQLIDLDVDKTGAYGLYPVEMDGVLVENCRVTGAADAGIYVGQSKNATVRGNRVAQNVTGIEIENTVTALVENNEATDNTAGLLAFVLPNNPSKVGQDCIFRKNRSHANNRANFGAPQSTVAKVPAGLGIFIMAAERTTVTDNDIYDNKSAGIALVSLKIFMSDTSMLDVKPDPNGTTIKQNRYMNNGTMPDKLVLDALGKGGDIIWDGSDKAACADEKPETSFVPTSPSNCP